MNLLDPGKSNRLDSKRQPQVPEADFCALAEGAEMKTIPAFQFIDGDLTHTAGTGKSIEIGALSRCGSGSSITSWQQ